MPDLVCKFPILKELYPCDTNAGAPAAAPVAAPAAAPATAPPSQTEDDCILFGLLESDCSQPCAKWKESIPILKESCQ